MKSIAVMIETSRAYGRALMEGVAAHAQEAGDWKLRSLAEERVTAARLLKYDGVIVRLADRKAERAIVASGVPAIDVYGYAPHPGGLPVADGDHERTGEMAAEFFLGRGFVHLAWCGFDGLSFSDRRGGGFCQAVRRHGLKPIRYSPKPRRRPDPAHIYSERLDSIPDARELAAWLKTLPKPAAVFCCHDYRAYQLMLVAEDLKLKIPNDLAILGVDNDTTLCSFAPVPLSSIDPNAFAVGKSAAEMLDAAMKSHPRGIRSVIIPPAGIVQRESTDFIPTEIPWLSAALLFIEKNWARGISAADVIAVSGRSSTYAERLFRRKTGRSIHAYLTQLRLKNARRLLETTDLQVKAVAASCGYASAQYFNRAFLKAYGRSPLSFRPGSQSVVTLSGESAAQAENALGERAVQTDSLRPLSCRRRAKSGVTLR